MYIRPLKAKRKTKTVGDVTYQYLQLVESYRTENGPRQRLMLDLGPLPLNASDYKTFVQELEWRLTGQKSFLRKKRSDSKFQQMVTEVYERLVRKQNIPLKPESTRSVKRIDTNSIQTSHVRTIGPEYACYSMWNALGLNEWLKRRGYSDSQIGVMCALVIGRLIQPGSDMSTKQWLDTQSGLKDLIPSLQEPASLSSYYRANDHLFELKSDLEAYLQHTERTLFNLTDTIYLYDMTNSYLEGQALSNDKAKYGRSKEKRSDCKLLTLGLVVDKQGFAKNSQFFSGNQNEATTLPAMIESLSKADTTSEKIIVMDAGIATADNLEWIKQQQYHYIVCHRGKPPFNVDENTATEHLQSPYQAQTQLTVSRHIAQDDCYLHCHSHQRQLKETGIRSLQEQRFLAQLEMYQKKLLSSRKRTCKTQMEMIGRLKERFSKAAKLYEITVKSKPDEKHPDNLEKSVVTEITWEKKPEVYEKSIQGEGCYVLRTDLKNLSNEAIWSTYIMLTRLESTFRQLKSWLGLRPIFHQVESRTDAHFFISVLAYHLAHMMEYKCLQNDLPKSWPAILKTLQTHQSMIIEYDELTDENTWKKHHIVCCSEPDESHKQIYKALNIPASPFRRIEKIYDKL